MTRRRVALVAGGSGGIGGTLVDQLSQAGYAVIIHYFSNAARAQTLCRRVARSGGSATALGADLRSSREAAQLVASGLERFSRIDLLVNAAGITRDRSLLRMSDTEWNDVIATHLSAAFHLIRSVASAMRRQDGGQIINIGSLAARTGRAGQANYSAAKAGLVALTQSAARELAPYNIRANVVLPGIQPTGAALGLNPRQKSQLLRGRLLGRSTPVEEVCAFILQLASMSGVSGQVFNLDSRLVG